MSWLVSPSCRQALAFELRQIPLKGAPADVRAQALQCADVHLGPPQKILDGQVLTLIQPVLTHQDVAPNSHGPARLDLFQLLGQSADEELQPAVIWGDDTLYWVPYLGLPLCNTCMTRPVSRASPR
jgi:hypothetical protein